jgi:hypothetical protein
MQAEAARRRGDARQAERPTVGVDARGAGRGVLPGRRHAGGRHPGLYEQELTLFYLIMEIGVCQDEILF